MLPPLPSGRIWLTALESSMPAPTIDCIALALPDKSEARNSCQLIVTESSSLAFSSASTSLPKWMYNTPNKANLQASRVQRPRCPCRTMRRSRPQALITSRLAISIRLTSDCGGSAPNRCAFRLTAALPALNPNRRIRLVPHVQPRCVCPTLSVVTDSSSPSFGYPQQANRPARPPHHPAR